MAFFLIEDVADLYVYQRVCFSTIMQICCSAFGTTCRHPSAKILQYLVSLKFASSPTADKRNSYTLIVKYNLNCSAGLRPTFV